MLPSPGICHPHEEKKANSRGLARGGGGLGAGGIDWCINGMECCKLVMWKGHHSSLKGIRKGQYLFCLKTGILKGKGLNHGAKPSRLKFCWVSLIPRGARLLANCSFILAKHLVEKQKLQHYSPFVYFTHRFIGMNVKVDAQNMKEKIEMKWQ